MKKNQNYNHVDSAADLSNLLTHHHLVISLRKFLPPVIQSILHLMTECLICRFHFCLHFLIELRSLKRVMKIE